MDRILVVNAGSTSLKLAAVDHDDRLLAVTSLQGAPEGVTAVGHRFVHGGARFREPVLIDDDVKRSLAGLTKLAPLHNAPALAALDQARRLLPNVPHVAVFDTAFHATMPEEAATYALPARFREQWGIRRYGFHGLSYAYLMSELERVAGPEVARRRVILAHLGSGASLAAVHEGRSIDTTMGFTPLEGVPMATRAGTVDPGALLYLLRAKLIGIEELEYALEHESGLLGLSGISASVEELEQSESQDASRALESYCYRIASAVAAMTVALGGLDALVFTAGVGEHSPAVRASICERLGFLGVALDPEANTAAIPDCDVGDSTAAVRIVVLRAREDLMVARAVRSLLGLSSVSRP